MIIAARKVGLTKAQVRKIFGKKQTASGAPCRAGRPTAIAGRSATQLHKLIEKMQTEEGEAAEITAEKIWLRWKARGKPSLKTLRRWLGSNYKWKAPTTRAQLTRGDVADRERFRERNGGRPVDFWRKIFYIG